MFFYSSGENQYVVQVYHHYSLYYQIMEYIIYHCLKDGRAVGHIEKHYQRLKKALIHLESGLPLISRLDIHIVKAPGDI